MKIGGIRTFIAALRGARAVGRASRLQANGNLAGARLVAVAGLEALRGPRVARHAPHAASALAALTLIAEESRLEHEPGASLEDIADSLRFLRSIEGNPQPELCHGIPFLERRLLERSTGNA